jgi:hypothetical protein
VTHFSHHIEATKEPKGVASGSQVKAKSRDVLWYLWVKEQSKLDNSTKVRAPIKLVLKLVALIPSRLTTLVSG